MKEIVKILVLVIGALMINRETIFANDIEKVVEFRGIWKFAIGDDISWKSPDYDDSDWERIRVPSSWENEGFHGYNGYAWYRRSFEINPDLENMNLYLHLGYVDDADEVYINGKLVGSTGTLPPNFSTAYNMFRKYVIPASYLNFNSENIIAVRVYDEMLEGGIIHGDVGIYVYGHAMPLELSFAGNWNFMIGDNNEYKNPDYDDSNWKTLLVPSYWDTQGYRDYDGFAWYRKTVEIPKYLEDERLVLVMGKIDDIDEVYINGEKIGSTGKIEDNPFFTEIGREYQQFRGYYLNKNALNYGKENVIAVRVYDGYKEGGIYEGPVGIITQKKYTDYWRKRKNKKNILELLFGN